MPDTDVLDPLDAPELENWPWKDDEVEPDECGPASDEPLDPDGDGKVTEDDDADVAAFASGGPAMGWYQGGRNSLIFIEGVKNAIDYLYEKFRFHVWLTQGGWNKGGVLASAGTHDGDAVDLSSRGMSESQRWQVMVAFRERGFAIWFREYNWDGRGGMAHFHVVPNYWAYPSRGAAYQATAYRKGRNGLASNGSDWGPPQYRGVTWPAVRTKFMTTATLTEGRDPGGKVVVDGKWGPQTNRASAQYLNTNRAYYRTVNGRKVPQAEDGSAGSDLIVGMQKWLGFGWPKPGFNGKLDGPTVRQLQRTVRVPVTGVLDTPTVKGWQGFLAARGF